MATYDLGDVVALAVEIRDAAGALANAGSISLSVTLPDGTATVVSTANPSTGKYTARYTPTLPGLHSVLWTATGANASAYRDSFTVLPAGVPLVSLDDVKARLNITNTDSDEELRRIMAAATGRAEQQTGRALAQRSLTQTVDMTWKPSISLTVPTPALLSISAVTEGGSSVAASDYEVSRDGQALRRPDGTKWAGVVAITGTVGVSGGDLAIAQQAVLELVAHLWETQRTPMGRNAMAGPTPGMGYALPNRVTEMLEPLILRGFA